jgi:hypothetical protein
MISTTSTTVMTITATGAVTIATNWVAEAGYFPLRSA